MRMHIFLRIIYSLIITIVTILTFWEKTLSALPKRFIWVFLLPITYLLLVTCDEILDIAPPEVEIVSPTQGEIDTGYVHIKIKASDNRQLDYVDLYFDGKKIKTFTVETKSRASLQDTVDLVDYQQDRNYKIEVKAYDAQGNWNNDAVSCFGYGKGPDSPILVNPVAGASLTAQPTFLWNSSSNAVDYAIMIDNDKNFTSPEVEKVVVDTEYASMDTLNAGTNYWKVRARNNVGLWGSWSITRNFTIAGPPAPTMVSPNDGAIITNTDKPAFDWNASTNAIDYNIMVDNNQDFPSTEIDEVVTRTEYTSMVPINVGINYWKVRARNNIGLWGEWSGVKIFTISGPAAPALVSPSNDASITTQPTFQWNSSTNAVDYEIVVDENQNFGNPNIDEIVNSTEYTSIISLNMYVNYYWKVRARNDVGLWGEWSQAWSFIIFFELTEVGSYNTPGDAVDVVVSGNYAYVADGYSGLRVINIYNPESPVEVGYYNTTGYAFGVAVSSNYAYVADGVRGLQVINISDTNNPTEVGSYDTDYAQGVWVNGSYVYVADWDYGLLVISVSNISNPVEVGSYDTPGYAFCVAVVGSYAYVADGESGLRVISVSNPNSPIEVGYYDTPDYAYSVVVSNNYAYVTDNESGLLVINVSDPSSPVEIGFYNTPSHARRVTVNDNYVYVADVNSGLQVIDVSNPTSPVRVGYYNTPGYAYGVAVSGNYAYVADGGAGLRVIDISHFTSGD